MTSRQAFQKKMKDTCPKCSDSTITTYVYNVFRLARQFDDKITDTLPKGSDWINSPKLLAKIKKMPLGPKRILSLAAVKALHAFGKPKNDKWTDIMRAAAEEYDEKRDKRQKTKREISHLVAQQAREGVDLPEPTF